MRKLLFLLVVAGFTALISGYKQEVKQTHYYESQAKVAEVKIQELIAIRDMKLQEAEKQRLAAEAEVRRVEAERAAEAAKLASYQATTCRGAIARAFPSQLHSGALIVLAHENRSENPLAIGSVNKDGSRDYGCFQINNHSHPQFFATQDWRDPVANAKYAYQVYAGRGNWTAWYAVEGILW